MSRISWLHLSDWHQKGSDFNRGVIAEKLLNDIRFRHTIVDKLLDKIDFIVFSGDIAFSGEKDQFELAHELLIKPIREILGVNVPIFCVPGNHDIERTAITKIPNAITSILDRRSNEEIENLLHEEEKVRCLNGPLKNFRNFSKKLGCKFDEKSLFTGGLLKSSKNRVGIACLNTAWLSARFNIGAHISKGPPEPWDRGILRITEVQIRNALEKIKDADVRIAIMHHPFDWLEETDQAKAEQLIGNNCHVLIHGHGHRPNVNRLSNAFGDLVVISAGACYDRRTPTDPRYTNTYNFCSLDIDSKEGVLFHRVWSEVNDRWRADDRFWAGGQSTFSVRKEPHIEQQKVIRRAINQLSTRPLRQANKRVVASQDTKMTHQLKKIGGAWFLQARIRSRWKFYPGEHEKFLISTRANSRIASDKNSVVRNSTYRVIKLTQNGRMIRGSDQVTYATELEFGSDEQEILYEYEILETLDGLYNFAIRRFTERATFTLIPEPKLEYEFIPLAGFPAVERKDGSSHVWETHEASAPNHGLMIQWYPKK